MQFRNVLLGTTALLGASLIAADSVKAQELEFDLGGYGRMGVGMGDLDEAGTGSNRDYDFFTDFEIHFLPSATDDETGITYGAVVELEADTNSGGISVSADNQTGGITDVDAGDQIDEAFLYLEGGFGEIQLGDNDGASDQLKIGAYSIAAGTGGIDGNGAVAAGLPIAIPNTGDSTKISYFSPDFGGLTAGVSFTPDSGSTGTSFGNDDDGNQEDVVEFGAQYALSVADFDVQVAGVGVIGSGEGGADDLEGFGVGASTSVFGFAVAGAYFTSDAGDGDQEGFNLGVGGAFGPVEASVTFGHGETGDDEFENLVFSATTAILPGVTLNGDVALFGNEIELDDIEIDEDSDGQDDEDGLTAVVRLDIGF